ncbi:MAG TPA: ABC transporter permease subunit [Bryobacteraceae bacterium]|nr:ABC transporter permease subunit [Bryobacteraceae bacterium]
MAVYKKTYRPYDGKLTPSWSRFLVIPRYSLEDLRRSKFLTISFFASFLPPLIFAIGIYVQHNASVFNLVGAQGANRLITIDVSYFMRILGWQSMLALFLAAFIGPGQVSPDLSNNGLALYLARPFSRVEYVLGKMSVLVYLLSLITWVPGLLLFAYQGYMEGWDWTTTNMRFATSLFLGAWIWIVILSLLSLALSAWVKWKPAAGGLIFGLFFVAQGFGAIINAVQRTNWGHLFNVRFLVGSIWLWLFEGSTNNTGGAVFFGVPQGEEIPLVWSCLGLALLCGLCLYMLARKIRGIEVVR